MNNEQKRWGWLGFADHQGVQHVGGRVGAAGGPKAFAQAFQRLKGEDRVQECLREHRILEPRHADIEQCHADAVTAIAELHLRQGLSVVIGGGNDYAHPQLTGVAATLPAGSRLGCVNIDAHFDLRKPNPHFTSGSPFYVSIESGILDPTRFVEFGIQRHCNAPELWEYARSRAIEIHRLETLRHGRAASVFAQMLERLAQRCDTIVVCFDLDAAASAFAPGVSAPMAEGFTSTDVLEMMAIAGQHARVASLGVYELNPQHDVDHRTAVLAATSVYHFVAEALKRPSI